MNESGKNRVIVKSLKAKFMGLDGRLRLNFKSNNLK